MTPLLAVLIVVLILVFLFPRVGAYNATWGYAPISIGGVLLIIFVVWLLFFGGLHRLGL